MTITNTPVQVSFFVADITAAVATYNRIRWHRSVTGKDGLYTPMTAPAATAPVLVSPNTGPHQLNGKTLELRVNGVTDVVVTFADTDPVTSAQAAAAIDAETALILPTVNADDQVVLTGVTTGSGSTLEVVGGDAAPYLGFAVGDGAAGLDQDSVLVGGTHEYFYTDQNSDEDYWYRTELRNSVSLETTGVGVPFPANRADMVARSQTMVAFIRLSDMGGYPIAGRKITITNVLTPNVAVDQGRRWGIFRQYADLATDRNGYAETRLMRGAVVDVCIDGTGFVRRITIPTTGDSVDMLDPALVTEDEFGIQQPTIDFAVRTS